MFFVEELELGTLDNFRDYVSMSIKLVIGYWPFVKLSQLHFDTEDVKCIEVTHTYRMSCCLGDKRLSVNNNEYVFP